MIYLSTLISLLGLAIVLYANTALAMSQELRLHSFAGTPKQLQIGEEWSRQHLKDSPTTNYHLNRLIQATAKVKTKETTGTAVYLGKYGEQHLMMTNHHVLNSNCSGRSVEVLFEALEIKTYCTRVLAEFSNLEATFFVINVSHRHTEKFEDLAMEIDFSDVEPGEKLVTAGYGQHLNRRNALTYEESKTCVVATPSKSAKFVSVQNKFKAWAFLHACETSSGDSGSVIVSERTGKIVGLTWATSQNKNNELKNSNTLFDWIENKDPRLWENMSLAVPTKLIMNEIFVSKNQTLLSFVNRNRSQNSRHIAKN